MFISARETKKIKTDRTIPFFSLHWPPPPFFSPLLLLPISALVSPASCSLLGTWHKKRKKKMIKSSADPWNLYVILHFFWLYLKEKKKTKSSAILVANWLFSLLHRVYVQFFNFFFNSPYSLLPNPFLPLIFPFLTCSIYCDPPTTHSLSSQFWFFSFYQWMRLFIFCARMVCGHQFQLLSMLGFSCNPFKKDDIDS